MQQSNFNRLRHKLMTTLNRIDEMEPGMDVGKSVDSQSGGDLRVYPQSAYNIKVRQELVDEEGDKSMTGSLTPYLSVQPKNFDDDYVVGETIGQGCHGVVKKCWSRDATVGTVLAVKIVRTYDEEIINTMKQTFLLASQLRHPSIVQHHKLYINSQKGMACMVMDFFQNPSLEDLVKNNYWFTEGNTKRIFYNIFEALKFLHTKGVCHRDIKPDNILVDPKSGNIKIIDFGVARRFIQCEPGSGKIKLVRMITQTGNVNFCAPEIFWHSGYNSLVDIWSAGVMLYLIMCKQLPFQQDQIMDFMEKVKEEDTYTYMNVEAYKTLSVGLKDLLRRMLQCNPRNRITAGGAIRHPWLLTLKQKSPTQSSKDDLQLESMNRLDRSDQWIRNGLTNSDQMPIIDMSRTPIRSTTAPKQHQAQETSITLGSTSRQITNEEFVIQPSPTTFKEMLKNFKQSTLVENIFVSNGFSQGINFVKSISSSVKTQMSQQQIIPKETNQFFQGLSLCDSSQQLDDSIDEKFLQKIVQLPSKQQMEDPFGVRLVTSTQEHDQD